MSFASEPKPASALSARPLWSCLFALFALATPAFGASPGEAATAGVQYTNVSVPEIPWSIHVLKIDRKSPVCEIQSRHAKGLAIGMSTLTEQTAGIDRALAAPIAAINGGFYTRDKTYAGCPRGLQIVDAELISAPAGNITFWIDVVGEPHAAAVNSRFEITWPDRRVSPFGLNRDRARDAVVLYTPAIGPSTHTEGGREIVLERYEQNRWLPLRIGRSYSARVREIRDGGNNQLAPGQMILSLGPAAMDQFRNVKAGDRLEFSTATSPAILGARTALSGGPLLVHNRKRQAIKSSIDDAYESSSMLERHPRTAIGWNSQSYFLVQVDGRQRDLSVGMTLAELAQYLVKAGCDEAVNLDGGGSSTLWFNGEVRNNPCDGYERPIANSLIVVSKQPKTGSKASSAATAAQISTEPAAKEQRNAN